MMEDLIPFAKSPADMSDEEKKEEITLLRDRLKALNSTPRSDWHREFERILRDDVKAYGSDVEIRTEEELGIDPPRVDYLILDDKKRMMSHGKSIFQIFRQHNVWEYKNPHDALNYRTISKIIGYGNFYIGLGEHEGDRPRDEVTLSIFRATRNKGLFDRMMADGRLTSTDVPGIYHVHKLTDLPFQIVIGNELKGDEYAAYRLLTDHADEKDVEIVAERLRRAKEDKEVRSTDLENGQRLLEFVESKNPGITRKFLGGNEQMASILLDVLQPEIDEKIRTNLYDYVQEGGMSIKYAAKKAGVTPDQFCEEMEKHGFKVPEMA